MRWEPIIISDAVYTRCVISHDKSLTLNCLVLFMMYWHKVQMSCRQTKSVVLRRGRHGSLFCVNSSPAPLSVEWRMLLHFLLTSSIYRVSFVFGQFGESLNNTHLPSREYVITWTWRHLYKCGWVTWMEIIPDRLCSIWFPNKVHRSSQNKYAECRINYFSVLKPANLKETPCMSFEVICELA